MKQTLLSVVLLIAAVPAMAQSHLVTASPIPQGAEKLFCYYAGLAYSENAFVLLTGSNPVSGTISKAEEQLLRCVKSEDGAMSWRPESTMQLGR